MASSADAVRNVVYELHLCNLKQGWDIVQQLEEKQLDSWEKIFAAFPVQEQEIGNSDAESKQAARFRHACPLLGDALAVQLTQQAALFAAGRPASAQRRHTSAPGRLGSLRQRMCRLYLKDKLMSPAAFQAVAAPKTVARSRDAKPGRLVPFEEAVNHPSFVF